MPAGKTISNPAGVWGDAGYLADDQIVVEMVNGSAGTLLPGDVVIVKTTLGGTANTTTAALDKDVTGVVLPKDRGVRTVGSSETYAVGAVMPVCVFGVARINIAANTVADKALLTTSAAAKVAATATPVSTVAELVAVWGAVIAVALEADSAKDANNTILAKIGKC